MSEYKYNILNTGGEDGEDGHEDEEEDLHLSQNYYYKKSPLHRYMGVFKKGTDLESTSQNGRTTERRFSNFWPPQGSKKGLLMALGIGVILMLLVISAAVLVSSKSDESTPLPLQNDQNEKITIPDVLSGKFAQRAFNGTWISDDEIQYFSELGDLVIYNVTSRTSKIIIPFTVFLQNLGGLRPFQCLFSADREFILVAYDSQKVYRHSSNAKYEIYDTVKMSFMPLLPDVNSPVNRYLALVEWAPVGNAIAFVFGNNIYYKPAANLEKAAQLTTDGSHLVLNGITDWVYEEEMFATSSAFWFSPQGTHLAYVTFNDTHVDMMPILYYGDPQMLEYQYPVQETLPYPKAGRANPTAVVTALVLPSYDHDDDAFSSVKSIRYKRYPGVPFYHLIGTVVWATDSELLITAFNRVQNESRTSICNLEGNCTMIHEIQEPHGWVDVVTPKVSENGTEFLTILSQKQSKWSYRHILLFNRNGVKKAITAGEFSIDSIQHWDEANGRIYFLATYYDLTTKKSIPSQSHLYYISDTGSNPATPTCLTCDLKNAHNEACLYNSVEISSKATYYVHSCNGPSVPDAVVRKIKNSEITEVWVSNADLRDRLALVALPTIKNFDIPLGEGFIAKARVFLPSHLNESAKYPLLVDIYGGPDSQKITDRFAIDWSTSLVSSHNVIYAAIDGRGSGRQSTELMHQVNRRLGTYEIEDVITGAKWLIDHLKYIDANRTAIWGWSYGGYATAMVMGTDTGGVYKCGISVAPVTSWLFYDTIYTERYMGLPTPEDNLIGYNISDVTNHIKNFSKKKYYLIHGNADDNVHYQQSMILSRALELSDILFRQQSYPDENHSLGGVRRHLYHSLEDFLFTECF